jgi:hypothetical protein
MSSLRTLLDGSKHNLAALRVHPIGPLIHALALL